jgi:hypothetical protein
MLDFQRMVDSLERFGNTLPNVVCGINAIDARWKPPDGAWSILEIVCHLADEEEFDFLARVKLTLADPAQSWPPIDPQGWSVERHYNDGKLDDALARFILLRRRSVDWLRSLDHPDWNRTHQHPKLGPFRAGDIFTSWVAHDYLHLRQIAKRMYQLAGRDGGGYSTVYAGEWRA